MKLPALRTAPGTCWTFQSVLVRFRFITIVLAFSLLCTACSKTSSAKKTVRLSMQADPISLDPRIGGDRRSQVLLRDVYEGLTRLNKQGIPELALAEKIDISSDGTVYTFYLREAQWSNGLPVTAHDFEYAWKGALDRSFASSFVYAFYVLKNAKNAKLGTCSVNDVGVLALDDKTLQVTLEHPTPYFLELAANPIFSPLNQSVIEKNPSWLKSDSEPCVSNGPFLLKEHLLKSHILLEKNPYYWDKESVHIDSLHFSILEDACTAYTLFSSGELDWYGDPCCIIPIDILRNMNAPLIRKHIGGIFWLVVCTKKPYLSSPTIRKAFASAINRKELVSFLHGGETPAFSNLAPFMSMIDTPSFQDHDVVAAAHLFEQGLQEIGLTKDTFPPITITHWNEPSTKALAEILQEQLQNALGIKVRLECLDWATYMKRVPAGEMDIATAPWYSWVTDPMFNLNYLKFRNNGINGTCWENAEYVQELDLADASIDLEKRKDHVREAEHIFAENLPLIPLFYMCYKYAKSEGLEGEVISPVGSFEFKWLEKKDVEKP
jgi:oligopeptide transport system substrate-binding protein